MVTCTTVALVLVVVVLEFAKYLERLEARLERTEKVAMYLGLERVEEMRSSVKAAKDRVEIADDEVL